MNKLKQIYRVNKFSVPNPARKEFLENVQKTHQFLRSLPGSLEASILEQASVLEEGEFNFVAIVVWESVESIEAAREAIMNKRKETGFDPQEMLSRLGIKADFGSYKQVTT